jgi:PAS domain S-box-containing protein
MHGQGRMKLNPLERSSSNGITTPRTMRMLSLTRFQRFGIAIVGVILTAVVRMALDPVLGDTLPLFPFVFAIIFAGWCGGLWPGLLATVLSLLLADYLFMTLRGSIFHYRNPLALTRVFAIVFIGTAFSLLFDTSRKALKAHLECLERFRLLVESARDYAIFTLDPLGRVSCWNTTAERIEGYGENEVVGHHFSMLYTPEDLESGKPQTALEIAMAEGRYEEECWQLRKDGSRFWASGVIAPLRDERGQLSGFAKITRDMTERRMSEEALRASEERYRLLTDLSPDGVVIAEAGGTIHLANPATVRMLGAAAERMAGRNLFEFVAPEFQSQWRNYVQGLMASDEAAKQIYITLRSVDGRSVPVELSAVHFGWKGQPFAQIVIHDLSGRKQAEEERERLLLREKAARLEAEAANRMKDEFLATVSHELRTPLTAIMGWVCMLTGHLLPESQTQHALQVIEQSAKSQARLVDDTLDVSRIIAGQFKIDLQPVEINRVFCAAIDIIRPTADAKGIALQAFIDDQGSIVRGDASRLQQVIWNLLSNAVKFTNEAGRVEARLTRFQSEVEISVTDTGIGIDPQFMPYLFERFRQADSTSTRRYGGLGLGLAIVRHVVEMHGGAVSASSAGKGLGSTFKVTFPVASAAQPQQPEGGPPPKSRTPGGRAPREERHSLMGVRVLVVEDDPDTLDMLKFVLAGSGAEVITAPSTSEALETLEHWRPDALVSDLAMPDQDGYELIQQVRSRGPEKGGNIPAVALSAYSRAEDRKHALAAGFQVHVPKPVEPAQLIAVVASLTCAAS